MDNYSGKLWHNNSLKTVKEKEEEYMATSFLSSKPLVKVRVAGVRLGVGDDQDPEETHLATNRQCHPNGEQTEEDVEREREEVLLCAVEKENGHPGGQGCRQDHVHQLNFYEGRQ